MADLSLIGLTLTAKKILRCKSLYKGGLLKNLKYL